MATFIARLAGVGVAALTLSLTQGLRADELTESALKRADNLEPRVPRAHAVPVETIEDPTDTRGPVITPAKVISQPAPGMTKPSEPVVVSAKGSTIMAEPTHKSRGDTVPAETSLRWLRNGNTRFVKRNFRNDGRDASDRRRLTAGQKPHAIVLSCSDSRVPPEHVFDQMLGEIYAIRVAGSALDSSVVASIEHAVEQFGSQLIVVMGHTQCEAVKMALATKEGASAGSQDLERLVADIRPRLKTVLKEEPSKNLEVESAVNADGVARELVRRSAIIRAKVESGDLVIKTALYRLDSGKVSFY